MVNMMGIEPAVHTQVPIGYFKSKLKIVPGLILHHILNHFLKVIITYI